MIAIKKDLKNARREVAHGFSNYHIESVSRGFLLPSRSLKATSGVAFGESLLSPGDFLVGDSIKLIDRAGISPVLVESHVEHRHRVFFDQGDIGAENLELKLAKSITLMSEFGSILHANIVHDIDERCHHLFLLLQEPISSATDYNIIAQRESIEMRAR